MCWIFNPLRSKYLKYFPEFCFSQQRKKKTPNKTITVKPAEQSDLIVTKLPVFLSVCAQRAMRACLVPAVRRGASVCTRPRVTTSLESVSVRQAGEENCVTKVRN